jgi:exopolyphosphatase/guanosine-5'-triphosphate,3'-diphosphate pyrophosphatase
MRIAALDLGSNSFLCLLCEANQNGVIEIHKDLIEIVRIGQDLNKTKRISKEALERARQCLTQFKSEIEIYKPEKIIAYATSAARDAENKEDFFAIGKSLGISIEVISGEKEAATTYKGVFWGNPSLSNNDDGHDKQSAMEDPTNLLIDIGGGSTEIICGKGCVFTESMSLNIGAVRMTEKWITHYPISDGEKKQLKEDIVLNLSNKLDKIKALKPRFVYAVAGTPTTLAAAHMGGAFLKEKIEGFSFTIKELEDWEYKLSSASLVEIINILKIPKGRADIIYSGVVILKTILETVGAAQVLVSTKGVRYGIVANAFP